MKIQTAQKMFQWILISTLAAFVMFNMANYYLLSQEYFERSVLDNQMHTRNVALSVSDFYETAYRLAGEMAQEQEVKSMDPAQQQAFLNERFPQHGILDNIFIQRIPDGVQTARAKGVQGGVRPERWWFRRMTEDRRPFVSPSFYSFGVDANFPTLATGIFFPVMRGDAMVSVIGVILRIEEVQARVSRYYGGGDRYTYILDEKGAVVAHPESEKVRVQHNLKTGQIARVARNPKGDFLLDGHDYRLEYEKFEETPGLQRAVEKVLAGETGTAEFADLDGKLMFCSYTPVKIPGYGASWAAVTVQDKNLAMVPLQRAAGRNAALSFIVLAGLAVMIIRQSRELEKNTYQLAETNATLEEEVLERTRAEAELTAANEELKTINAEMIAVTDELQHTHQQTLVEIKVRQAVEGKLRLRERQYRAMIRLVADNNAEFDVQMQSMLDSALELAGASDGYIALMEDGRAMIRYVQGNREVLLGKELTLETGVLPLVLATGKLEYIEDYQSFPERRHGKPWENQSTAIIFPLKKAESVVGSLSITWQDAIRPLLPDEIEMLQQFANLASLALQGALMRKELKRELLQRERLHEKISHMAFHDVLTGLPNRIGLTERLRAELAALSPESSGGVIFFIDLDDLKSINDNFGHSIGDKFIVSAGETIQAIAGEKAFVARLGGDEFIVLVSEYLETAEIGRLGDRLVAGLCRDYQFANEAARVSASVGIARFPQDGNSVEELMKKADNAMYAAKSAGRNCWRFFDPAMLRDAQEKMLLTNSMRRALERDEFQLVYQPQVALRDGRIAGFEALLRWHSKEHGNVSPARFIPLAEQNQLIILIGMWVLQQACAFACRISRSGFPEVRVAVNLSPKQLADDNLIGEVSRSIAAAGIDSHQLELEITESALLGSVEESSRKLHQLGALGVRLALDDFGTGYSSLTYLRLFPVETLKIDKTFIDNIPERETVLVQSLIHFAQSLKMKVVAEGVERQEQLDFLDKCGCDLVQGYIMSRPLPEEAAIQFLLERNDKNEEAETVPD